jgi:hypothetical protein
MSTKKRDQKLSIKGLAASPSTSRRGSLDETKRSKKSRAESIDSGAGPITRSRGNSMAEASPEKEKKDKKSKKDKKEKKTSKKAAIVESDSESDAEPKPKKKAKLTEESKDEEEELDEGDVPAAVPVKKDFITDTTFESLDIDALTKKALKEHMKYDLMTAV